MTPAERKAAQQFEAQRQAVASERGRLTFEARYADIPQSDRLHWLENEGDDGGSLWWHRAYADLTCLRAEETPEQFVARTIATRIGPGPDRPEAHSN